MIRERDESPRDRIRSGIVVIAKHLDLCAVMMLDQEGAIIARWDFKAGWPSKITGPTPKADSNEVGVEELVIVHEDIRRIKSRDALSGRPAIQLSEGGFVIGD